MVFWWPRKLLTNFYLVETCCIDVAGWNKVFFLLIFFLKNATCRICSQYMFIFKTRWEGKFEVHFLFPLVQRKHKDLSVPGIDKIWLHKKAYPRNGNDLSSTIAPDVDKIKRAPDPDPLLALSFFSCHFQQSTPISWKGAWWASACRESNVP